MTWRPLITEDRARRAIAAAVHDIVDRIAGSTTARTMAGSADQAVLHAYLAAHEDRAEPDDAGGDALSRAVSALASTSSGPGLFGGAAGIGWTLAHVAGGDVADAVCASVDAALSRLLAGRWEGEHDLISGLVGVGVYALERGEAGRMLASRVLDHLERLARSHGGGRSWFTAPERLPEWQRALAPAGYWNLGVAHGVPGVIAVLARYVAAGVEVARVRALLESAVAFLLGAEPPSPTGRYPSWQPDPGGHRGRLAWCYGDLGISIALLSAGFACDRDEWRREALALARACAGRSFEAACVLDAGLCHGAAGVSHLFNRIYQAVGDEVFAAAARRWVDRTLAMRSDRLDASMLAGSSGVALALLAAISDVDPAWDRVLLADLPAPWRASPAVMTVTVDRDPTALAVSAR